MCTQQEKHRDLTSTSERDGKHEQGCPPRGKKWPGETTNGRAPVAHRCAIHVLYSVLVQLAVYTGCTPLKKIKIFSTKTSQEVSNFIIVTCSIEIKVK